MLFFPRPFLPLVSDDILVALGTFLNQNLVRDSNFVRLLCWKGFDTHVWYLTSRRMSAFVSSSTSLWSASLLSGASPLILSVFCSMCFNSFNLCSVMKGEGVLRRFLEASLSSFVLLLSYRVSISQYSADSFGVMILDSICVNMAYHYAYLMHGGPSTIVIPEDSQRAKTPDTYSCRVYGLHESDSIWTCRMTVYFMVAGESLVQKESVSVLPSFIVVPAGISLELARAFLVIIWSFVGYDFFCFDPSSIIRIPSNESSSALSFLLLDVMYYEMCLRKLLLLAKMGSKLYLQIFVVEDASCDLYKLLLVKDMAAPTIPIFAEENLGDPINIRVDIIHLEPVAVVAFPTAAFVRTQAQHEEAIRGILEHLQGVPIKEEMSTLRFRMGMVEAENASLRGKIKTMEAIEMITRSQEKMARRKMERQLALVQESQQ
ncbi:hypothetical protein Tco_1006864 [Tanacetum coccineum]|uniref:Uncharacterized protein n=1 Tax=Tanacetum coccineum TaxID=301880 RepID=A0ABQ5FJ76_9ASTR